MAGPSYKIIHAFHHVHFSIIIFAFQQWSEHSAVAYVRKTNDEFWCAGEWWKKMLHCREYKEPAEKKSNRNCDVSVFDFTCNQLEGCDWIH